MKGRVERVSPVQSVTFEVARSFEDRRGFANYNGGQSFHQLLDQAMRKVRKPLASASDGMASDAYVLNVTRPTQSLFYQGGMLPEGIGNLVHE